MPSVNRLLDSATRGYLAGLLDGEGCIALRGDKFFSRPSIEVVMTTPKPLFWAEVVTRCGNVYTAKETRTNRRLPWRWVVTSIVEIRKILDAVQVHMKVKWAEAQVLRIFSSLRNGVRKNGPRVSPEADNRLQRLSTLMKLDTPDPELVYQEVLDLAVYLRQEIEQRKVPK